MRLSICLIRLLVVSVLSLASVSIEANSFLGGGNTCPSTGNKRVAAASIKASWFTIQSPATNTGNIMFGGSNVTTTANGVYIVPGGSFTGPPHDNAAVFDLSQIYFACAQTADTITYIYAQ